MAYFQKQEDPNKPGEFIYVEIQPTEVELPEDVLNKLVVSHPKYREVLDESKSRKEKLRELREQLKALEGVQDDPVKTETSTVTPQQQATAPVQPLDEETLYKKFRQRLQQETEAERQAKTETDNRLRAIADKHGLGAGALSILANSTDPEATAVALEKSNYRFDDQVGGAPSKPDGDALQANIFRKLGLE